MAGEQANLPEVIVPASFNFPHTGKLLSISFVLFAGWFADSPVTLSEYPRLAFTGLVTFFGSLNVAVPFLLDMFRIPADTFQLFLASGVINSRFGTLVAAMHTLAVALLGTCAMTGALTWNRARVVRYLAITVVLTIAVIGGSRLLFARAMHHEYSKDKVLAGMHLLHQPVRAVVHKAGGGPSARTTPPETGARLDIIRRRGVLTVGYLPESLPYAFFNAAGDLVGLDVELAHRLAAELNVSLEFVPLDRERTADQVNAGECDIAMSGVAVTTLRASRMLFSTAYLDETMAFIAPDGLRTEFATWDQLRQRAGLRLGIPNIPYYIQLVRDRLPQAKIEVLPEFTTFFTGQDPGVDALVFAAERGSAWTLMHPRFAVVIPEPDLVRVPLAYPIGQRDQALATFVSTWIELKRKDGTARRALQVLDSRLGRRSQGAALVHHAQPARLDPVRWAVKLARGMKLATGVVNKEETGLLNGDD